MGLTNPSSSGGGGAPTTAEYWVAAADATLSAEKIMAVVRKASDETVNNSTAMQDDDALALAVGAADVWEIDAVLRYDSSAVADIKFGFTVPASGAISGENIGLNASDAANIATGDLTTAATRGGGGAGTVRNCVIRAIYIGGGTAGNVTLRWAQNTAEATDTKVLANSVLIARKVA